MNPGLCLESSPRICLSCFGRISATTTPSRTVVKVQRRLLQNTSRNTQSGQAAAARAPDSDRDQEGTSQARRRTSRGDEDSRYRGTEARPAPKSTYTSPFRDQTLSSAGPHVSGGRSYPTTGQRTGFPRSSSGFPDLNTTSPPASAGRLGSILDRFKSPVSNASQTTGWEKPRDREERGIPGAGSDWSQLRRRSAASPPDAKPPAPNRTRPDSTDDSREAFDRSGIRPERRDLGSNRGFVGFNDTLAQSSIDYSGLSRKPPARESERPSQGFGSNRAYDERPFGRPFPQAFPSSTNDDRYPSRASSNNDRYPSRASSNDDRYPSRAFSNDDRYSSRASSNDDRYPSRGSSQRFNDRSPRRDSVESPSRTGPFGGIDDRRPKPAGRDFLRSGATPLGKNRAAGKLNDKETSEDNEAEPEAGGTGPDLDFDASEEPVYRENKVRGSARKQVEAKRRAKGDKSNRRADKFAGEDDEEAEELLKAQQEKDEKKRLKQEKKNAAQEAKLAQQTKRIELPPFINVINLATLLKVRPADFAEKLQEFGFEGLDNEHVLNFENASLIAMEFGMEPMVDRSNTEDLKPRPAPEDMSLLPPRPPVVTIMGHVDHGKTTLLDYMRSTSVAASEHGGITQHIGAFSVSMSSGKLITFLDTPGHAAFLSMRQRGANVTDIVILVVAADDSVKPQTIEAIKHARAAKVPIIVAINKVDKEDADVEKVKQDLLVQEIEVEDYGGDIQAIPVSGKTGLGLDALEEAIVTQAEILDMRAETDGPVEGWVLEATTKRAGRIATVLVRRGTLRRGDIIVAGTTWARVRTLKNEAGVEVEEASPGTPVEIDGWKDQPNAGDEVLQAPSEQKAASVVDYREARIDQVQAAIDMEVINEYRKVQSERREVEKAKREEIIAAAKAAGERYKRKVHGSRTNEDMIVREKTELFVIIKADVSGSAEAIEGSLNALPLVNQPLTVTVLRSGVGMVSESDIDHISAVPLGNGFLISFNQDVPSSMLAAAEKAGVKLLDHNIIYKAMDDMRELIEAKLPPIVTKRVLGDAEIAKAFDINIGGRKTQKVAGCRVRNGTVTMGGMVSVYRGAVGQPEFLVYQGKISTLKSQKKDVQEMRVGTECGMSFDEWTEFEAGDIVQEYTEQKTQRRLG